jgi:hypothetical protein
MKPILIEDGVHAIILDIDGVSHKIDCYVVDEKIRISKERIEVHPALLTDRNYYHEFALKDNMLTEEIIIQLINVRKL